MKLGHQLVDLGGEGEAPVEVVLVGVEAAFLPNLLELLGQVVVVVGDAERDGQIAVVADLRALVRDADAEVAKVLVLVGLQGRFAEDLSQDLAGDLVPFTRLGVQVGLAFGLPILLLGRLQLPAFVGVADELSGLELLDRRLHLGDAGRACRPHRPGRRRCWPRCEADHGRTPAGRSTLATRSAQP